MYHIWIHTWATKLEMDKEDTGNERSEAQNNG